MFIDLGYQDDLESSSNLQVAVGKLPPDLRLKWNQVVSDGRVHHASLEAFSHWLQRIANAHERSLATAPYFQRENQAARPKQNVRSGNVASFATNVSDDSRNNSRESRFNSEVQCPLKVGKHRIC